MKNYKLAPFKCTLNVVIQCDKYYHNCYLLCQGWRNNSVTLVIFLREAEYLEARFSFAYSVFGSI